MANIHFKNKTTYISPLFSDHTKVKIVGEIGIHHL
jgi:hypothetical protein